MPAVCSAAICGCSPAEAYLGLRPSDSRNSLTSQDSTPKEERSTLQASCTHNRRHAQPPSRTAERERERQHGSVLLVMLSGRTLLLAVMQADQISHASRQ